jgi:hypothetical protein
MYDNWWTCLFDYLQVHDRSANMFEQQPGRQFSVCMVVGQSGIELNRFTHDSQQMKRSGIQPFEWCNTSVGFQASTICTVCVRAHLQFLLHHFTWCQCNSISICVYPYVIELLLV